MDAELGTAVRPAQHGPGRLERWLGTVPLVPDRLRAWVVAVTLVAIALVAGLGFYVRGSNRPVLFDRSADSFLRQTSGPLFRIAADLSDAGDPRVFVTITAVIVLLLVVLRDYRAALASVGAVAITVLLVEDVFKPFFGRRYGSLPGPTFPSGHTAVAMALAGAVVLATGRQRPLGQLLGPIWRPVVIVGALARAGTIGLAMVSLQLHYMTDVATGVPLGLAVAGCTGLGLDAAANWLAPVGSRARSQTTWSPGDG
jgi:membrane-associated phospholipid phosphatase